MKQILYTFLLFCTIAGLAACRKDNKDVDIKTYDEQQIQAYIKANNLTGFSKDLSGGDTTGMYYKMIKVGTGKTLDYPDQVAIVFTIRSFDGQYVNNDTLLNHIYNYVGHIDFIHNKLPVGFQLAILNVLKNKGSQARLLIPSRLAYGKSGFGSGSVEGANRIAGNQGLDCTIRIIDNAETTQVDPVTNKKLTGLDLYDDMVVQSYITGSNLTGFTKTPSGLWYKITAEGSGAKVTEGNTVEVQYSAYRLNGQLTSDNQNSAVGYGAPIDLSSDSRRGLVEGLLLTKPGTKITLFMPSRLAFGYSSPAENIPTFSCLRYDINVISIQ